MSNEPVRRPGEALFALFLVACSLFLLSTAYGISGFEALSSPGALPMAASATMLVTALAVAVQTLRAAPARGETARRDIVPVPVLVTMAMVALYALLLKPLGFLPTSFLFLAILIKLLSRRGVLFSAGIAIACVAIVYLVFRIVFGVLMPEGIVPEREILAAFGRMIGGR
jgi:putative tricarboxylic transport membrane protein